jgi:hypothetical protein
VTSLPPELTGRKRQPVRLAVVRDVAGEVLEAMPEGFVFQYHVLWLEGLGKAVGGRPGLPEKVVAPNVVAKTRRSGPRTSTSQTETRGGAKKSKSSEVGGVEFASEAAVHFRRRIDAKLRKLGREIRSWRGDAERSAGRRCSYCKRFGDDEWVYCPWCRSPMEEVV